MKPRLLFLILVAIFILLIFNGTNFGKSQKAYSLSTNKASSFNIPFSAKFIPVQSDISFHWKISPNEMPQYFEKIGPKKEKKRTKEEVRKIINTLFSITNIDFEKSFSQLIGSEGSFGIINWETKQEPEWILAFEI